MRRERASNEKRSLRKVGLDKGKTSAKQCEAKRTAWGHLRSEGQRLKKNGVICQKLSKVNRGALAGKFER